MDDGIRQCTLCEESMWWVASYWLCGHCDSGLIARPTWMDNEDEDADFYRDDDSGHDDDDEDL